MKIDFRGERFLVGRDGDWVWLVHPTLDMIGVGRSIEEAKVDLIDDMQDHPNRRKQTK